MTRNSIPALLLGLFAAIAASPTLPVGHLSDDWVILSHVSRHGTAPDWSGPWLGMSRESILYYRPLFTSLYAAEFALAGTDPLPARIHHLLWHVAAVLLLHGLLRSLGLGTAAALFGAALFAVHPAIGASVGWLAARCGIGAATLTLLTAVLWMACRRRESEGLPAPALRACALASAAMAPLFQESGYLALTTPLILDGFLGPRRRMRHLIRRHAPFAAAGAILLLVRFLAIGTLGGGYPNASGLLAGGEAGGIAAKETGLTLLRTLAAIPPELFRGNLLPGVGAGLILCVVVAMGIQARLRGSGVARTPGGAGHPSGTRVLSLLGTLYALQFLLIALSSNPALNLSTGHRWYLALAFLCGALAAIAAPLLARPRTSGPCALLLVLYLGGFLAAGLQLRAGDRSVRKVLDRLHEIAREPDLPKGPMIVSCLPEARRGIPTFHWGLREALNPPFAGRPFPREIYPVHRFMYLETGGAHNLHPPIEALLYASGRDPGMVTMVDPHRADSDEIRRFDFTLPTGDPERPYVPVPREGVAAYIASLFSPVPVRILEPAQAVVSSLPLSLPLRIAADGAVAIELFAFLPTFDTRMEIPIVDGEARADPGPKFSDYLRFLGGDTEFFLVAVAYEDQARTRMRLSPAIAVQVEAAR